MSEYEKKKGGARLQKPEKSPRMRKEKIRMIIILVLIILLALLLIGFAIYRFWARPPEVPATQPQPTQSVGSEADNDNAVTESPQQTGDRKKDFYTFLVVGRDTGGGGNTDTILLAAYDVANQKLNVMSIPRDTMVNVPWEIKRINSVYNMYGGGEKGLQQLYSEVSQLVGFVPDYQVIVEWNAVGDLVDAIGGVYFEVPFRMYYNDLSQHFIIDLQKGYQLLDGDAAMQLVRYRKQSDDNGNAFGGYPNGDIGRIETQQAFLKAVVKQCLQIENVTKIQELAKVFTHNVKTDLTLGNLVWFAEQAIFGGLGMENVNFITLPANYDGYAWSPTYRNYQSYVLPAKDELLAVVNESFNPYLKDCTLEQLDIMSVNPDGSVSSTTGVVEDSVAAKPPVIPKPEPKPEEPEESEGSEVTDDPETMDPLDDPEQPGEEPGETEESGVSDEPGTPEQPGTEQDPIATEDPAAEEQPEPEPAPEAGDDEVLTEETPVLPPLNAAA